jgi:hypothetical protein
MPIEVEIGDTGQIVEFPDGTAPETMQQALKRFSEKQAPAPEPAPRGTPEPVPETPETGRVTGFEPFGAAFAEPEGVAKRETGQKAFQAIPSSTVNLAKAIAEPILSPVETVKSLKSLAVGAFQKLTPGIQPDEKSVDALVAFLKDRYGSIEGIQKTIETDPVGMAADLSAAFTGGGALASKLLPATTKAGQVAKATATAGRALEPVKAARLTANAIKGIVPKEFAERLYESAAKIKTTLKPEKRTRLINAALDEGIVPTKAGLAKTNNLIKKYTNQVDDIIDEGFQKGRGVKGKTIKTDDILSRLDEVRSDFEASILSDVSLIDDLADNFKAKFGERLTFKRAQEAKRALQKDLKKAFGERKGIEIEGAKNIARGIREELEVVFPEIGGLNQRAGALIDLNKELERAVGRISNRNIFGLTQKIFAAAGVGKEAPGAGLILALSESVLGNPRVKARMAIALKKAGTKIPPAEILNRFKAGAARQSAFQAGRASEVVQGANKQ